MMIFCSSCLFSDSVPSKGDDVDSSLSFALKGPFQGVCGRTRKQASLPVYNCLLLEETPLQICFTNTSKLLVHKIKQLKYAARSLFGTDSFGNLEPQRFQGLRL